MSDNFLDTLIVGSKVIIDNDSVGVVVNITPKRSFDVRYMINDIPYNNPVRFNKYGTHKIDSWRNSNLYEYKYEDEIRINEKRNRKVMLRKIRMVNFSKLSTEKLKQILEIAQ